MFTIYSHKTDQEPVNNVVFASTPVDENIDAWVCPSVDPDFIEIKDAVNEYGGAFFQSVDDALVVLVSDAVCAASAAWTRKEGQNKNGGLNEKGRKSYPGNLKRPQPKGKRHDSFCKRMYGMLDKRTSSKTKNDPNSRINLALKKWKCRRGK